MAVRTRFRLAPGFRNVVIALVVVSLLTAAAGWDYRARHAGPALHAGTVALDGSGSVVEIPDESAELIAGTRVVRGAPQSARLARDENAWLTSGSVPSVPELAGSTMARDALLDLHVLAVPGGVPVAGWSPSWRYIWPRDSAYVAAAFARTGHLAEAERVIACLQQVQPESGLFEARYLPDGDGVPDGRGVQTDGLGWALWAMLQVADELPPSARAAFVSRYRGLLDKSVETSVRLIDDRRGLPAPSTDYWEVRERKLTLSTAAMLAAGLRAGGLLYDLADDPGRAATAREAATHVLSATHATFAKDGYPRRVGGSESSVDLGVSFLLPPFSDDTEVETLDVWRTSADRMRRPAGGLSPGGSWKDDGISWTTSTSSFAVTAAFVGDRDQAVASLRWIDAHRTRQGSIPEKVLYDGRPASVAPIAWSAAAVIIALDELQRRGL